MTWSNTEGGDHEGDDWTPENGITISGIHYNIGIFTIASASTINISSNVTLEIHAETIVVEGIINGVAKGYSGGTGDGESGSGPGGGGGDAGSDEDGTGGSYGGVGGDTDSDSTYPGATYGTADLFYIQQGSGGGAGDNADGGSGGGCVFITGDDVTISGTINCYGGGGSSYGSSSGGGGGSGGGILIAGNTVNIDGATLNAYGGTGGDDGTGGGGGGGRIKIFYYTSLSNTGLITSVAGGYRSGGSGTTNTTMIGLCDATYSIGQTFHIDTGFPTALTAITINVKSVTTSGDFTLSIWDSPDKTIEYVSKTVTISSIGDTTFTFDSTIQLPASDTDYYVEIESDGTGDIKCGVNGYSNMFDGSMYYSGYPAIGYDIYMIAAGYSHVMGPVLLNTANTNVKCEIANSVLSGAIHVINRNGSGTVDYSNDFSDDKYISDAYDFDGVTYDDTYDWLELADDSYIYWLIDTKYPIAGVPTLTSQIEVIVGTPTLQISYDGDTWYNIDDDIVNNVSTVYNLISGDDVKFKGRTNIWVRLDCTGISTNTCIMKNMAIHADMVTVHAQMPEIVRGTNNIFRLDQDSGSAINCTINLDWKDRKLM